MSRSVILLVATLALGVTNAAAQTMQADPMAPTRPDSVSKQDGVTSPDSTTSGLGAGDRSHATQGPASDDSNMPPANPPLKDETVGVGSTVDRAPRDIREPFDE